MQNINLVYAVGPGAILIVSLFLLVYWRRKRTLTLNSLAYSLLAYGSAIALKAIIQFLTLNSFTHIVNGSKIALGVYYGLQTAILEVGIAILVAMFAVKQGRLGERDSEGYGLGLSFWENGVLLGIFPLIDYFAYYAILSSNTSQAQTLFNILSTTQPVLFYPIGKALPLIGYYILERTSSILVHFTWGLLALLGVVFKRKSFFALIFLSGFLEDFLVAVSGILGLQVTEALVFVIACLTFAAGLLLVQGGLRKESSAKMQINKP
ncbi:MAG: hypothetical protein QXV32_02455 [Conexivisphaerales archaeon]